ncbi:hypothetical protein OIU34_20900 [Pararhizobium sp. BT-229]|uniref:hypothetical protein n=1 Tax=Pararhizobium sp. BT-229 TaxID=2986923 RepID=UPI0021F69FB6|nr:hypothetical protein [Pararhizobium sp. BT-229]MCV9964350.1 hypothetical protein [Pararhizobium sp. BT-229]
MKFTTEVFDISGRKVEITRVPARTQKTVFRGDESTKAGEQALFEIRLNGEFIARAVRPFGFGKMAYKIERLYQGYDEDIGDDVAYGNGYLQQADRLLSLERVAEKAVELRDTIRRDISSLPTREELDVYRSARAERRAAEKAESDAREVQRKADRIAEREAEDAHFRDVIDGLKSIDERLGTQLNNFEINALRIAIAKYEKERDTILSHRAAFEDDEFKGR